MNPIRRRVTARDGLALSALDWAGDAGRTPLLCLTGISRTAWDYEGLADRHAGRRRVVALDYAGHGESAHAPDIARYQPRHVLGDILDCCAALHLPRAVVIGTSMGGLMAMFLSLVRPGLLRGVLLNDIGPKVEAGGLDFVREFIGRDPALATEEEAALHLRRVLPTMVLPDEAAWRRFANLTYQRGADGRLHPRWDTRIAQGVHAAPHQDFGPVFRGLRDVPTALVWGERSDILSAATVRAMVREKPDLTLITLPGAGHAPTLEEREIVPDVDAFLGGIA